MPLLLRPSIHLCSKKKEMEETMKELLDERAKNATPGFTSTTKESLIVKPKEASSGNIIRLSRQDRIMPPIPVPLISIFDSHIDYTVSTFLPPSPYASFSMSAGD